MDELLRAYKLLGNYISVVPLCIGLVRIRKLNWAFLFFLSMIACETGVAFYSRWQGTHGINNLPSLHFMTFIEMLLGGLFFYLILEFKLLKRILILLVVIFLGYSLVNSFYIQSIYDYNQIPRTLEGYLFVLFSFFYFYELLKRPELVQLSKTAEFWAVIGFFTYFGTTQFVHLFSDYTAKHYFYFYDTLRLLNISMIIVYYSLFAFALWKKKKLTPKLNESTL